MIHLGAGHWMKVDEMKKKINSGWLVVSSILLFSTIFGVFSYKKYIDSEKIILNSLTEFDKKGKKLNGEECITEVLDWNNSCLAMKSLCDHSVPRLMNVCLQGQNRDHECQRFAHTESDSRIGVSECYSRRVKKKQKKNCTTAYMVWNDYCQTLFASKKDDYH